MKMGRSKHRDQVVVLTSTFPRSEISPVMAAVPRARRLERTETIAVTSATPAEGPSLGTAPAGT